MVGYLRSVVKKTYFKDFQEKQNRVLLSKPVDLGLEKEVFRVYREAMEYLMQKLSLNFKMEEDRRMIEET